MTEQEVERLTGLLHDAYPCSQQGCRETGEQFAALVAEVRRLRGLVSQAALSHMQAEALIEAAFRAGYEKGKHGIGEFWPAARQMLDATKREQPLKQFDRSFDARKALEGA